MFGEEKFCLLGRVNTYFEENKVSTLY